MKACLMADKSPALDGSKASYRARPPLGFTLLELLVVLVTLSMLAGSLVPTLAGSRISSQAFRCLNNNRQLCSAWRMYADDNHDILVYASDDGTTVSNPNNQYAWTWTHMDYSPANRANWDTNLDIVQRPLWPYTSRDASIYRCPSDSSSVVVNGTPKPRVRSFSMNAYVGGYAPPRTAPLGSPGTVSGIFSAIQYRVFSKTTDFNVLPPAMAFVFVDERPDAINWGNFYTDMSGYQIDAALYEFVQDFPAIFHNFGSSISFADGRAEIHRWLDARTAPGFTPGTTEVETVSAPRDLDVAWLQDHATRPKQAH
jgi:prepilin-type N-terminal cleavage/methylation domain-containing protein